MMYIWSHNPYSEGAKVLATALDWRRLKHEGSRFVGKNNKFVVNWGASQVPDEVAKCSIINKPDSVGVVTNKLIFFNHCREAGLEEYIVPFTNQQDLAREWVNEGKTVVARTVLTGSSGEGIIILDKSSPEIVDARLYTQYVPKSSEWRLHFFGGEMKYLQRKVRDLNVPDNDVNWKVRNLAGGFKYAHNDVGDVPACLEPTAKQIFNSTGLDFGAVDVIYNERRDKAYVLEINTAPGLQGITEQIYRDNILELINKKAA